MLESKPMVCGIKDCKEPASRLFCAKAQGGDISILYRCVFHQPDPARSKARVYNFDQNDSEDSVIRLRRIAVRAFVDELERKNNARR